MRNIRLIRFNAEVTEYHSGYGGELTSTKEVVLLVHSDGQTLVLDDVYDIQPEGSA